jgi:hypothetical protein
LNLAITFYRILTLPTLYPIVHVNIGSGFKVRGSGFGDSPPASTPHAGFSAAAGLKSGQSNRKRNFEKANIEQGIMNVEVGYSIDLY